MSADFEFFEKRVRPILVGHCYACHNKSLATSGLRLDNRNGLVSGGSRGAVIVPGDPSSSLLIRAVNHADGAPKMPPSGKLSPVEIADLTAWIQAGAPDPRTEAEPTTAKAHLLKHWAFQPVKPPAVPRGLRQAAWVRNSVDSFVLAALEAKGLRPAAAADKRTLLRRVTFDLTGLPPSPDEIRRFLADQSADAYAKAVERLLESPHYGERWGRHWLDLVRFGETMGHEFDPEKVEAWRYRDYVIRAFNRDLPYDHFIREQLAGDLLPRPSFLEGRPFYDPLAATGFLHLYEERNFADDLAEVTAETVDNQIDVLSKSMMGLTVSCAKCHDHKFDPIPTSDYYSLAGVMHSTRQVEVSIDSPEDTRKITIAQDRIRAANREIFQFMEPIRAATAKDIAKLLLKPNKAWRDQLELAENDPTHVFHPFAILAKPSAEPFSARVVALKQRLERGLDDWKARGDVVFADFRTGNYDGWETHGPAFRPTPADSAPPPNQPAIGYRGGGLANSFGGASKTLTGTLVSRSFTVPKQYMHARMSGSLDETRWREHGTQRLVLQIAGRPGYFTQ